MKQQDNLNDAEETEAINEAAELSNEMPDGMFDECFKLAAPANRSTPATTRKEVTFILDGSVGLNREDGAPVFSGPNGLIYDLEVTMRSLVAREEIAALKACSDSPESAPFMLAKSSLYKVSGTVLDTTRKEWFWEAIGPAGRQVCLSAFNHVGSASMQVLKKYQSTIIIG